MQSQHIKQLQKLSDDSEVFSTLMNEPDWRTLEKGGVIPRGSAEHMKLLCGAKTYADQFNILIQNPETFNVVLRCLTPDGDPAPAKFLSALMVDLVREDTMRPAELVRVHTDAVEAFYKLLLNGPCTFVADRVAFLMTAILCHQSRMATDDITGLAQVLVDRGYNLSNVGALASLCNLLKIAKHRVPIWNIQSTYKFLGSNLKETASTEEIYHALFAVWLFTFSPKFIIHVCESGLLFSAIKALSTTKKEKLVRLGLNIIVNCLPQDAAVEIMLELDIVHAVTLLEYENWRDEDLYADIRDCLSRLNHRVNAFTNFDRYVRELETGTVKWNLLHTDKFWQENYMQFEVDEFAYVKKLVQALRQRNSTTLAVVCHDLGEFARLHPTGKLVLNKLRAKEMVMALMSHKEREVSREALLCMQKMMLNRWQDLNQSAVTVE